MFIFAYASVCTAHTHTHKRTIQIVDEMNERNRKTENITGFTCRLMCNVEAVCCYYSVAIAFTSVNLLERILLQIILNGSHFFLVCPDQQL